MLIRLFLILLLATIAQPGTACVDHRVESGPMAVMTMSHGSHHMPAPQHHEQSASTGHCVGCIPPSDWQGPKLADQRLVPPSLRAPVIDDLVVGRSSPPALPPPRLT